MASAARRTTAVLGVAAAAFALVACSRGNPPAKAHGAAAISMLPQHILHAPKSMLAVTEPQANGAIWALAGPSSAGLFKMVTGQIKTSFSVSDTARSVAESSGGIIALALGSVHSGALELVNSRAKKVVRNVPLPAPAKQVVVGSDGTTFYVLTGWATTASVTIVNGQTGQVKGTVPMPSDVVSMVPDIQQATIYALERDGLVVGIVGLSRGRLRGEIQGRRHRAVDRTQPGRQHAVRAEGTRWDLQHRDRGRGHRGGQGGAARAERLVSR